ncbi:M23 family metallopeptidase [Acinetobacter baumannii]|uniref:M23 family metallopeptidase n=2 Tax=Acinetobacter baumannii TaxID=470 RepID=A0AAP1QUK9_ACIBA|nr:M23 family metallopeptidase [Acinetobacter baumannii]MBD2851028.1 M23 family metallopeptidase [Acinetobacter baumannii]MBD3132614.1 M23 family metallopeptidase [Acinetobacter baumannii]MBE0308552.1 M23 family metallopeptidase [Acinetobacter baumannii]MBE0311253.1 M23 family metallopeptidase [Acinetobacter baumannii]MBE0328897.1 M23 family metallopeptidase [Acinetobacter baumannii]
MKNGKSINQKSYPLTRYGFICAVSRMESSSDLSLPLTAPVNIRASQNKNSRGYIGFFQFGEAALIDLGYYKHWNDNSDKTKANDWTGSWVGHNGVNSLSDFLKSPAKQIQIIGEWIDLLCKRLRNRSFNEYYGKIVNGIEITESGAIAGAHLVGEGGLGSFLGISGFKGNYKEVDGNNVHISRYIDMFNHYDLESCCSRKIYIILKNQIGQIAKNKKVTIESEYSGKFKQPKFIVNAESDEQGLLPVIIRHPGSKIIIKADGKQSAVITQASDKKQSIELSVSEDIKIQSVLQKPAEPEPKQEKVVVVEQKTVDPKKDEVKINASKDIKFDIAIIESDTNRKITNMRFFVRYKGKIKEHTSDSSGIKTGIIAEEGENLDILVNGSKGYQKLKTISVIKGIENSCISVPLGLVSVKLKIHDSKGKILKNNKFFVSYRGREIQKTTDSNGFIQLKMLNAFVYKLLLSNKKPVLTLRNDPSISVINVNLNSAATTIQMPRVAPNPPSKTVPAKTKPAKETSSKREESFVDYLIDFIPSLGKTENVHTEKNGNPLTKQYGSDVAFTIKTINKETGKEENLAYSIKYNGVKRTHYTGQDGIGLKKHRGEEGKKIEIVVDVDSKEQVLYTAILKNPMPVIEIRMDKPKDDDSYLFPLKARTNSYKNGFARFGSNRSGGKRKHAGCDLYAPTGTEIRAMADGKVRVVKGFYSGTDVIEIVHKKHIIRYGEVLEGKSLVKVGDDVKRGQTIGYVGKLTVQVPSMMLHLEMYSNPKDTSPLTVRGNNAYQRRSDLIDPTTFLDNSTL